MLATNEQSKTVMDQAAERGGKRSARAASVSSRLIRLDELTELEKRVLVEKHLISPNLANESRNGAVILSENEASAS